MIWILQHILQIAIDFSFNSWETSDSGEMILNEPHMFAAIMTDWDWNKLTWMGRYGRIRGDRLWDWNITHKTAYHDCFLPAGPQRVLHLTLSAIEGRLPQGATRDQHCSIVRAKHNGNTLSYVTHLTLNTSSELINGAEKMELVLLIEFFRHFEKYRTNNNKMRIFITLWIIVFLESLRYSNISCYILLFTFSA